MGLTTLPLKKSFTNHKIIAYENKKGQTLVQLSDDAEDLVKE